MRYFFPACRELLGKPMNNHAPELPNETVTNEEIAELAYAYWEQRADAPASPEEEQRRAEDDWCRAEQDLLAVRQVPLQPEAD